MTTKNRRTLVQESKVLNGIDFVEVANDAQTSLRVHFLNGLNLAHTVDSSTVTITGGESIATVFVNPINDYQDWGFDSDHLVLNLTVAAPGDFSNYTLTIAQKTPVASGSPQIDPFFSCAVFSFKARCPSDLDCQAAAVVCPATPSDAPPIDYLSKDFLSFRQALLDFSALRYPEWQERSEADFGVMFLEALSALADDLSYTQDRIAAEASLENATQRRSLVRMARLVDYWPSPALASTVLLQFEVSEGTTSLPNGLAVTAPGPDGAPIPFETGTSLAGRTASPPATVNSAWNPGAILPYWFDDSQQCLRAGTTHMYVLGRGFSFRPGQALLIETAPAASADVPIRQIVHLLDGGKEECDPLIPPPTNLPNPPNVLYYCADAPHGTAVTRICWATTDALTADRDLNCTILGGNLVAATQGLTQTGESFFIPPPSAQQQRQLNLPPAAIVRTGPNDSPGDPSLQYMYTLRFAPLVWLKATDPTQQPQPEIVVTSPGPGDTTVQWEFANWLLTVGPYDWAFTVDAALYSRIAGTLGTSVRYDYDGDAGDTLRFGDGIFGALPEPGTTFSVTYRSGGGLLGNVAADSITSIDRNDAGTAGVISVTNPMPAMCGADPETPQSIQRLAPQAFRAVQYRAVLPADYAAAAETLPWVERAGTVFRWTGSWLTVFTTPEPVATEQIAANDRVQLIDLLNRYRMAGYESYVPDPDYLSVDVMVQVCAVPTAFRGDVEQALLTALGSAPGGFFAHANFTFGQSLEKSALEAAVQGVNGVAGVTCVQYRIRGRTLGFTQMGDVVAVGAAQIIRCDNDPSLPGNGSLQIIIEGGK